MNEKKGDKITKTKARLTCVLISRQAGKQAARQTDNNKNRKKL